MIPHDATTEDAVEGTVDTSLLTGPTSCSALARQLGEPLGGSAAVTTGWIAIEHRGSWSPRAPSAAELGPITDALATDDVRVQLIRRPRRAGGDDRAEDAPLTVLVGRAAVDPSERWLRRVELETLDELLTTIDPSTPSSPTPPALGDEVGHDVWLVCTHGRRDACCALHGRPVAAALQDAGAEVWETTHTGGHRFAATAVLLPDGLSLGRLDTVPGATLVARAEDGRVDPELIRGRCALPRPVQAAETMVRRELGIETRDGVLPVSWRTAAGETSVDLVVPPTRWRAVVRSGPTPEPRPVSDDATPTTPDHHELVSLSALRD